MKFKDYKYMYFKQIFEKLLTEETKYPKPGTATKEQIIKLIIEYFKTSDMVFDDSDYSNNIEYYLKNKNEAKEIRDILESKHGIKTVRADVNKNIYWLGLKNKKYDKEGYVIDE